LANTDPSALGVAATNVRWELENASAWTLNGAPCEGRERECVLRKEERECQRGSTKP